LTFLSAAVALAQSGCTFAQGPPPERLGVPDGYELAWADEFDVDGLPDPQKWAYDISYNRRGWHNREQQYYSLRRPENARVENGRLVIEARSERLDQEPDWGGQSFTSARLVTRGLASWTHGYFEISAKLPCARGTWPAIWMLPVREQAGWRGGEIDIAEHVGFEPNRVHHSVHTEQQNFLHGNHRTAVSEVPAACGSFRLYQMHWTPDEILIGVDGRPAFSYQRAGGASDWPFDQPFYLLLNVAVGGTWGGAKGIDAAALPSRMEVDYVRVYQPIAR
jgi:beta-glucanase (GH16 family)